MANMGDYADMDAENVESAEVVCPRCGSRHVAQILHGMPAFTEELPVSYTHLDVYKRQHHKRSRGA